MTVRPWMDDGTTLLLSRVDALPVNDPNAANAPLAGLPGWTRAHLLAHVASNAVALRRLAAWARTGVKTPMYASKEARDAEIEQGARKPLAELVEHVHTSAADLARELDELHEDAWDARVRTAQGRDVPAREIVWMRTREVWIHAVDLDPEHISFRQFPTDLLDALITDVVATFSRRDQVPGLTIAADDADQTWSVDASSAASDDALTAVTVRGNLAELAAWLTGRGQPDRITADGQALPELPAWL